SGRRHYRSRGPTVRPTETSAFPIFSLSSARGGGEGKGKTAGAERVSREATRLAPSRAPAPPPPRRVLGVDEGETVEKRRHGRRRRGLGLGQECLF
uniref:Uncharacterized protein n=1 Tax=Aegilops tauschii subsp. strangulata TaxID=200361 RepID=A0A453LAQ7_AEGTS